MTEQWRWQSSRIIYAQYASYDAVIQTDYEFVLYFFMVFTGVVGNVITCVVITSNKTMHTITNAYLFNLAIFQIC